jgi:hypothetical protein
VLVKEGRREMQVDKKRERTARDEVDRVAKEAGERGELEGAGDVEEAK